MRRLRKIIMTMLVLATASSTLIAATPHYACRCPDGTIKLFCAGTTKAETSCCKIHRADKGTESPCCQGKKKSKPQASDSSGRNRVAAARPGDSPTLKSASCQKILIQPDASTIQPPQAKVSDAGGAATLFAPANPPINHTPLTIAALSSWRVDNLPPPTDFVTVLQRFTI